MKKIIIRIITVLILLVIVGLVVLFFSLNSIVKKGVETVGPKLTKVDVKLGSADISPFSGSGKLSKLFVGNPADYKTPFAMQMDSIKVGVQIGSVISGDTIIVNEVDIESPEIQFDGGLSGNNLSTIQKNLGSDEAQTASTAPASSGGEKKQKKFIVKDLVLKGAKVHLNVTGVGIPMSATVSIPDIHLQNIGEKSGGVTAAELCDQVMQPLYDSILKQATSLATGAVKNVENLGKGAVGQVTTNLPSGIGDLFKKK